jgi:uncharacterized membrane protein
MALRKSTRVRTRAPAPVPDSDLSWLIRAQGTGQCLTDNDRALLRTALIELQTRRLADSNRAAGLAKRMVKQRNDRADQLFGDAGGQVYWRDTGMQRARDAKALGASEETRETIREAVRNARANNHRAIRLRRQARQLRESARQVEQQARKGAL